MQDSATPHAAPDRGATAREPGERSAWHPGTWLGILALLALVYVLCSGPAVWLCRHGYLRDQDVQLLFQPLAVAAQSLDPGLRHVNYLFMSYIYFWYEL